MTRRTYRAGVGTYLIHPGGSTMRRIWVASCLATILLVGQATAADLAQKAKAAERKAGVLEQKVVTEGSKALPSPSEIITKPEAQAVDPAGEEPLNDAITCLSRTIYWEARGEDAAGMEAIANVVMNRLGHEGFPNKICDVVKQGSEQGDCQFSWWCDGRSDDAEEGKSYAIAKEIARKALNRQLTDRTGGALYFHHRKVTPSWSPEYIKTFEVGEHVFYKPRGSAAK
ncbi:MAG: cell wall hydrolase, SleB-type [Nitrospirae bacterium]|nr:cell wall hydrolase, SleB-type [Nitrospirota bacterium]